MPFPITALEIEENKDVAGVLILSFNGMMDSANISEKKKVIMNAVKTLNRKCLLMDFSKLEYINSESIGLLFEIHEILEKEGRKLVLVGSKPNVADVFKVIGLFEIVPHYKDMAEFLSDFHKKS